MKGITAFAIALGLIGAPGFAFAQNTPPTDAQIRQNLESQGYTGVKINRHERSHIDVSGVKNGKLEKLAVNPNTGQITADTDKDED